METKLTFTITLSHSLPHTEATLNAAFADALLEISRRAGCLFLLADGEDNIDVVEVKTSEATHNFAIVR